VLPIHFTLPKSTFLSTFFVFYCMLFTKKQTSFKNNAEINWRNISTVFFPVLIQCAIVCDGKFSKNQAASDFLKTLHLNTENINRYLDMRNHNLHFQRGVTLYRQKYCYRYSLCVECLLKVLFKHVSVTKIVLCLWWMRESACGALVDWCWKGKGEVLREKPS
jgi:hypothetical protein